MEISESILYLEIVFPGMRGAGQEFQGVFDRIQGNVVPCQKPARRAARQLGDWVK